MSTQVTTACDFCGAVKSPPAYKRELPSYIEAQNDQLGLKLVSSTGPSHYLLIDQMEEPMPK